MHEIQEPVRRAATTPYLDFVEESGFVADDRETIDLRTRWRSLRSVYEAVPDTDAMIAQATRGVPGFDLTVMKPTQAGASIFCIILAMWFMLRRFTGGYFLPVATTALYFSEHRFLKLARQNPPIHRLMGDPTRRGRGQVDEGSAHVRTLGDGRAYFTYMGGKVTTEALALDWLVLDEVQEMLLSDIQKVQERIASSALKSIVRVSTANFVGADIHHFYELSDQREFHTRCRCGPDGVVLTDCWDPTVGPLCIDAGNGTTPGVPREPFYFCPKCKTVIRDPQDGRFIAHAPDVRDRIGFHWGQMLSPWQTARSILEKWRTRVDTAHFYRRVLGMPFTDPDSQPVTEAMLLAAQNRDLRWGPPQRLEVDGVFMGLDQMGHDIHVVIVARVGDRMRLLHLEIIQADDPWRRAAELMRIYHVRFCGVEALPNFNEAHRFAKAHEGRVFVVYYQDHLEEVLTWGDRPSEKVTVRRTDDALKTRYTASADQYKLMSLALSYWSRGLVETPDARTLVATLRTSDGERPVQVCSDPKLGFWLHMQRVALVTELPQGRQDERKPRRAVKKVGIDPHFAYAWMLMMVGWSRAYGTEQILGDPTTRESVAATKQEPKASSYRDQIAQKLPGGLALPTRQRDGDKKPERLTCNDCAFFDPDTRHCEPHDYTTTPDAPACDEFVPVPKEDAEWR